MDRKYKHTVFKGLTVRESAEIIGLDYVLTMGYSDNVARDTARYKELSQKRIW